MASLLITLSSNFSSFKRRADRRVTDPFQANSVVTTPLIVVSVIGADASANRFLNFDAVVLRVDAAYAS